jgi:dethiobiotin synthetase
MKLFITGTDTGVGKTYISVSLLHAFKGLKLSTLGIKPIASGCKKTQRGYYSQDALDLQCAASIHLDYAAINPFAFEPGIAPHIAASQTHDNLSVSTLNHVLQPALMHPADICLIEGVGGWYTPLNTTETLAHWVMNHHWPVILIVGMRLGCLNHALLTQQALTQSQVPVIGWIANCLDINMNALQENINALKEWLQFPCLGIVPYQGNTINISLAILRHFAMEVSPEEKA